MYPQQLKHLTQVFKHNPKPLWQARISPVTRPLKSGVRKNHVGCQGVCGAVIDAVNQFVACIFKDLVGIRECRINVECGLGSVDGCAAAGIAKV